MHPPTMRGRLLRRRGIALTAVTGLTALAGLAVAAPAMAADSTSDPNNIVTNSNFAAPAAPAGSFTTLAAGSTALTSWVVGGDSIDLYSHDAFDGVPTGDPAATQAVDLSGNDLGSVSQTLSTTAGVTYTGSFEVNGNTAPSCGGAYPANLTLPGQQVISFVASGTSWVEVPFQFTATGSSSTITFTATGTAYCGAVITDVIVDPPAGPGTPLADPAVAAGGIALFGALALGLFLLRRRRATGS